jgi:hypothetical protein
MLIRFYNIIWEEDNDLPSTVTMELEDSIDDGEIDMHGCDMLKDEFGEEVDSFEWEKIEEDDKDDPFSFGADEDD